MEYILKPNIPTGSRVLEIGPGAGRWTAVLLERASHLKVVDVTPKCIDLCRQRFQGAAQIDYYVNDGSDLSFLPPGSIDRIWSWDVFVHLGVPEIERYVQQFATILSPGAGGVLHHATSGRAQGRGWRTGIPAEQMRQLLGAQGLRVVEQFNSWNNEKEVPPEPPDLVTVFERPSDEHDR